MFSTPEEIARLAVENDVHVVGRILTGCRSQNADPGTGRSAEKMGTRRYLRGVAGGVIPPQDYAFLQERGVAAIYGPGTPMLDSVRDVLESDKPAS